MKIKTFFENVFAYGLNEKKIEAVEKIYGGKIQESTVALIVSCMRERTLVVDGEMNRYILLTLDEILKPNKVFADAKLLPLFKADEDRYICYNFNASEEKKIGDTCLFNFETNEIEQQYPGIMLFFKSDLPAAVERAKQNNSEFQSLIFLTSDTKICLSFGYDIVKEKGVKIKIVLITGTDCDSYKNVDILVPFHPTVKFDKMMRELQEKKEKYQVKLDMLRADWPNQLTRFAESGKFSVKEMFEKIKEIDMYANVAPIYETVLEKFENKEI